LPELSKNLLLLLLHLLKVDFALGWLNEEVVLEGDPVIEHDLLELAPLDLIIGD
jgi:hypothetical protein